MMPLKEQLSQMLANNAALQPLYDYFQDAFDALSRAPMGSTDSHLCIAHIKRLMTSVELDFFADKTPEQAAILTHAMLDLLRQNTDPNMALRVMLGMLPEADPKAKEVLLHGIYQFDLEGFCQNLDDVQTAQSALLALLANKPDKEMAVMIARSLVHLYQNRTNSFTGSDVNMQLIEQVYPDLSDRLHALLAIMPNASHSGQWAIMQCIVALPEAVVQPLYQNNPLASMSLDDMAMLIAKHYQAQGHDELFDHLFKQNMATEEGLQALMQALPRASLDQRLGIVSFMRLHCQDLLQRLSEDPDSVAHCHQGLLALLGDVNHGLDQQLMQDLIQAVAALYQQTMTSFDGSDVALSILASAYPDLNDRLDVLLSVLSNGDHSQSHNIVRYIVLNLQPQMHERLVLPSQRSALKAHLDVIEAYQDQLFGLVAVEGLLHATQTLIFDNLKALYKARPALLTSQRQAQLDQASVYNASAAKVTGNISAEQRMLVAKELKRLNTSGIVGARSLERFLKQDVEIGRTNAQTVFALLDYLKTGDREHLKRVGSRSPIGRVVRVILTDQETARNLDEALAKADEIGENDSQGKREIAHFLRKAELGKTKPSTIKSIKKYLLLDDVEALRGVSHGSRIKPVARAIVAAQMPKVQVKQSKKRITKDRLKAMRKQIESMQCKLIEQKVLKQFVLTQAKPGRTRVQTVEAVVAYLETGNAQALEGVSRGSQIYPLVRSIAHRAAGPVVEMKQHHNRRISRADLDDILRHINAIPKQKMDLNQRAMAMLLRHAKAGRTRRSTVQCVARYITTGDATILKGLDANSLTFKGAADTIVKQSKQSGMHRLKGMPAKKEQGQRLRLYKRQDEDSSDEFTRI